MWRLGMALALAALAAGCGSDPSSFEGSGDALENASSSRMELKVEGSNIPAWASMRESGAVDYANGRGELVIKGNSDSGPVAKARLVGHDAYLGVEVAGSMRWMKESVDDSPGTQRFLPGPGGTQPDRLLKALIDSSKSVDKLDGEQIRGVATTHYRAHLDKAKVASWNGIKTGDPGDVDVWIDGQGLPRRIRIPYGGSDDTSAVVDLFDFGVPVDVEAPPAGDIVSSDEFDKLMEKACASAGKDLEKMNPLCMIFGATLTTSDKVQIEPEAPVPATQGK